MEMSNILDGIAVAATKSEFLLQGFFPERHFETDL